MMNKVIPIKKLQQPFKPKVQNQIFHNVSGVEKADKGRYEDAFESFTRAIELNPKDADAYFNRATLKVSSGDLKGASSDFKMSEECHRDSGYKFVNYPLL
jgi:tetratricopeptide (TPR) repeat protein